MKHPSTNTSTWSATNVSPVRYLVIQSRARLIGLLRYKSTEPPATKSGTIAAVDASASPIAIRFSHHPTPRTLNISL
jgi:hypothetical protein